MDIDEVETWKDGKEEVEILRYWDDEEECYGDYEVWEQYEYEEGSWDGNLVADFKTKEEAIKYVEDNYLKNGNYKKINMEDKNE